MKTIKITKSYPGHASFVPPVIVSAIRCIRRTVMALKRIELEHAGGGDVTGMLMTELTRQRESDHKVREILVCLVEYVGDLWERETREAIMTLLMMLVALDDRTESLNDRIMEEQNKKGD